MLRPATDDDVERIRAWRNHPMVRRASIFTEEITPEAHRSWWRRVSDDPGSWVLIFEYEGTPAGVVIFKDHEPEANRAEWGFFLDNAGLTAAGRLFPAWIALERAAVDYAFGLLNLRTIGGRTLAWNAGVLELHRRTGFREVPERSYVQRIDDVQQEVRWTEMHRHDWKPARHGPV
jgi:UDP-4-amino-4,6-dideoxy-N-acetyl-beta-L-altrosamine N-acetyltransferase